MKKYISFDIGGTKVKHGLIQHDGKILTKSDYPTETKNLDIFIHDMLRTIDAYKLDDDISGIAISMPGYIDIHTGYSEVAGAILALAGENLKLLLEEHISLPVEIENDGNCVALAERISGNAQGCDNFICMTIGTGIGGGIFLNGEIYRGHQYRAGEFGMMHTVFRDDTSKNMHDTAAIPPLLNQYKKCKQIEGTIEGEVVFEEAKDDPMMKTILDNWIDHISRGVFNLAVTLNPQKILIGGGVSVQEYLLDEVMKKVQQYEVWEEFKLPIIPCKYRNDAGMLGAFYHFMTRQKVKTAKN